MALYKKYENTKALLSICLCNFGGLEILDVEYDGDRDKAITCFNWGTGRQMIRRNTIYTTVTGRRYIRKAGNRYYLDEMM